MNKQFMDLISIIMVLLMAATIAVTAQETSDAANDAVLNNTTSNGTTNLTAQTSLAENDTNAIVLDAAMKNSGTSQNLSTVNNKPLVTVPISEIAKNAPEVAAGSSSAQVSTGPEGALKIGSGIGGLDPFKPEHVKIDSLKLGLPIKPMRDTSKMFFVCDIV